jgi:hypothetical protein
LLTGKKFPKFRERTNLGTVPHCFTAVGDCPLFCHDNVAVAQ